MLSIKLWDELFRWEVFTTQMEELYLITELEQETVRPNFLMAPLRTVSS